MSGTSNCSRYGGAGVLFSSSSVSPTAWCCCCCCLQENDLLHKQNELLRSSEAAYQKEAQLVSGV